MRKYIFLVIGAIINIKNVPFLGMFDLVVEQYHKYAHFF